MPEYALDILVMAYNSYGILVMAYNITKVYAGVCPRHLQESPSQQGVLYTSMPFGRAMVTSTSCDLQRTFLAPSDYMDRKQRGINSQMRGILIDWLVEVNARF